MLQPALVLIAQASKILFIIFLIMMFVGIGYSAAQNKTHILFCIALYGIAITSIAGKMTRLMALSPSMHMVSGTHRSWDSSYLFGDITRIMT